MDADRILWLVEDGDVADVVAALKRVDINIQNREGWSLLHQAVHSERVAIAEELIRRGIDVNLEDGMGQTPLHYAAARGSTVMATLILEHGGNLTIKDAYGNTPLWYAISYLRKSNDMAELFLRSGSASTIDEKNVADRSPLDAAYIDEDKKLVALLKKYRVKRPARRGASGRKSARGTPNTAAAEPREIPLGDDAFAVAKWMWQNLVPPAGQAKSVQGELLRAVEKLRWEAQTNGNGNWDKCFRAFVRYVQKTLCGDSGLSAKAKKCIREDLAVLGHPERPYLDDDFYDHLTEHIVEFCRLHPQIIPKPHDPKQFR